LNIWPLPWLTQATRPRYSFGRNYFQDPGRLGVVVLMFIAGVETDLTMMRRTVAPAFWAATGGVLLPMAGGYFLSGATDSQWPRPSSLEHPDGHECDHYRAVPQSIWASSSPRSGPQFSAQR